MIPVYADHDASKPPIGFVENHTGHLRVMIKPEARVTKEEFMGIFGNVGMRIVRVEHVGLKAYIIEAEILEWSSRTSFITTESAEWSTSYRCRKCDQEFTLAAENDYPERMHKCKPVKVPA